MFKNCDVCGKVTYWVVENNKLICWTCGRPEDYKGIVPKFYRQ